MDTQSDVTTIPRMWLWEVAILASLPIGGYVANLVVNEVDSVGAALAGGLIVGAVIGSAEWSLSDSVSHGFGFRRRLSGWPWAWSQEPPW
jgi:hypothetical protein